MRMLPCPRVPPRHSQPTPFALSKAAMAVPAPGTRVRPVPHRRQPLGLH